MPATSKAQRIAAAIAEHHPGKLYARNRGLLAMSKHELHKFSATKEKGLPKKKGLKEHTAEMARKGKLRMK
jgi:hypothetical protein